jgi:hypothetical protein
MLRSGFAKSGEALLISVAAVRFEGELEGINSHFSTLSGKRK